MVDKDAINLLFDTAECGADHHVMALLNAGADVLCTTERTTVLAVAQERGGLCLK